jgi:ABC-type enterochelin transport system substrate-binding protein
LGLDFVGQRLSITIVLAKNPDWRLIIRRWLSKIAASLRQES